MMSILRSCTKRNGVLGVLRVLVRLRERLDLARLVVLRLERFEDRDPLFRRDDLEVFPFVTEESPEGAIIAYGRLSHLFLICSRNRAKLCNYSKR
jgi:hypothetical protein